MAKIKQDIDKDGNKLYPITVPSAVIDPDTGKNVTTIISEKVSEVNAETYHVTKTFSFPEITTSTGYAEIDIIGAFGTPLYLGETFTISISCDTQYTAIISASSRDSYDPSKFAEITTDGNEHEVMYDRANISSESTNKIYITKASDGTTVNITRHTYASNAHSHPNATNFHEGFMSVDSYNMLNSLNEHYRPLLDIDEIITSSISIKTTNLESPNEISGYAFYCYNGEKTVVVYTEDDEEKRTYYKKWKVSEYDEEIFPTSAELLAAGSVINVCGRLYEHNGIQWNSITGKVLTMDAVPSVPSIESTAIDDDAEGVPVYDKNAQKVYLLANGNYYGTWGTDNDTKYSLSSVMYTHYFDILLIGINHTSAYDFTSDEESRALYQNSSAGYMLVAGGSTEIVTADSDIKIRTINHVIPSDYEVTLVSTTSVGTIGFHIASGAVVLAVSSFVSNKITYTYYASWPEHKNVDGTVKIESSDAYRVTGCKVICNNRIYEYNGVRYVRIDNYDIDTGLSTSGVAADALATGVAIANKQDKLTTDELAAVDSGITAEKVAAIATNTQEVAKISSKANYVDLANMKETGDYVIDLNTPTVFKYRNETASCTVDSIQADGSYYRIDYFYGHSEMKNAFSLVKLTFTTYAPFEISGELIGYYLYGSNQLREHNGIQKTDYTENNQEHTAEWWLSVIEKFFDPYVYLRTTTLEKTVSRYIDLNKSTSNIPLTTPVLFSYKNNVASKFAQNISDSGTYYRFDKFYNIGAYEDIVSIVRLNISGETSTTGELVGFVSTWATQVFDATMNEIEDNELSGKDADAWVTLVNKYL